MKTLLRNKLAALAVALVAIISMSSCSSDTIEMIPDDVDFAVKFNFEKALTATDITLTDDDFELPDEISALAGAVPDEVVEVLTTIHKSIKLDQVYLFGYNKVEYSRYDVDPGKSEIFMLAQINDKSTLKSTIDDNFEDSEEKEGFEVYPSGDVSLLIKGDYVWLYAGRKGGNAVKAANAVKSVIEKADDKNITELKGVAEVLTADNIAAMALKSDPIIKLVMNALRDESLPAAMGATMVTDKLKGTWMTSTFDIDNLTATLTSKFVNPTDGAVVDFNIGKDVSNDILAYLGPEYFAVGALGLSSTDINNIADQLTKLCNSTASASEREMALKAIEQLRNIDGTAAIALGSNDLQNTIFGGKESSMSLLACIDMKSGAPQKLLNEFTQSVNDSTTMNTNLPFYDGEKIRIGYDSYIYIKATDTNLVISTNPIRSGRNAKNFAGVFKGNQALAAMILPLSELTSGRSNAELDGAIAYDKGKLTMQLSIANCKERICAAIVEVATAINQAYSDWWNANYRYNDYDPYGYDYNNYYNDYDYPVEAVDSTVAYY